MAKKISATVGKGGKNKPEDVQAVQELLNDFTKLGNFKKLDVDGLIGPKTLSAIASFQTEVVGMAKADSKLDPSSESMKTLSAGASKAASEMKKADKAAEQEAAKEAKAEESGASDPQVKGETRGLDKGLLAVLEAVSAHYGKPIVIERGKASAAGLSMPATQAWDEWCSTLGRGKKEESLADISGELDKLYNRGKQDEFVRLIEGKLKGGKGKGGSPHAAGKAVDIKKNTDSKVVAALATILHQQDEGDVIHFDDGGKSLPKTITDAMKKKWK